MKKQYLKYIGVLIVLITFNSCKKYLDINDNPNVAEVVEPKLLFSNAVVNYINVRSAGDLFIPISLAGQSMSSGGNNPSAWGFPTEEQYEINALSLGNVWRTLYTSVGSNLKEAIKISENAPVPNNNAAAQCKVLLAMCVYDITTLYGDVPFTEAWNPDIPYPKFDSQQVVLNGVVSLLDEALSQFDDNSPLQIGKNSTGAADGYDLIYNGNLTRWKKLAHSMKLKALMTMVDKDNSKAALIGQLLALESNKFISSSSDNALVNYSTVSGRKNPKFGINEMYNGNIVMLHASKWVVDFMNSINDPRLPKFFDKPASSSTYVAPSQGETADDAIHSRISTNLHRADAPEIFFTYQEQLFYQSEAFAKGVGVASNITTANTLFRQAVAESSKFFGVSSADSELFSSALPDLSTFNTSNNNRAAVKYIHYHHWVDKMDRGLDNFTQWRRSGSDGDEVPLLTLPTGAPAGPLIRRYEYPINNEIAANPNAPKDKILYNIKMWFDL